MTRRDVMLIAVPLVAVWGWLYFPWVPFELQLHRIHVGPYGVPTYRGLMGGTIDRNTYDDWVSSGDIEDFYWSACSRLDSLRGGLPRKTYCWEDGETWERLSSVVQFTGAYVVVTSGQGNDNDFVNVKIQRGVFLLADDDGYPRNNFREVSNTWRPSLRP